MLRLSMLWSIVLVLLLVTGGVHAENKDYYRIQYNLDDFSLNVRHQPSIKGTVVGFIPEGVFIGGTKKIKDDWVQLKGINRDGAAPNYDMWMKRGKPGSTRKNGEDYHYARHITAGLPKVYLNKEMVNRKGNSTIFSKPGFEWVNCPKDSCEAERRGWPHYTEPLELLDTKFMEVRDEFALDGYSWKVYYNVRTPKGQVGWIGADYVDPKKFLWSSKPVCPPKSKFLENIEDLAAVGKKTEEQKVEKDRVKRFKQRDEKTNPQAESEKIASQLSKHMGKCFLDKEKKRYWGSRKNYKRGFPASVRKRGANSVDVTIVKHWRRKGGLNVSGRKLKAKDLVAIDTLARTMYGEMAGCDYKHGHNAYSTAVAATANNRVKALGPPGLEGGRRFGRKKHWMRAPLTDVLSSRNAFSVWNKGEAALSIALCPPSNSKKGYWLKGRKPNKKYVKLWNSVLAVAVETYLYPEQFRKRTSQIRGHFYTSRINWKKNFKSAKSRRLISEHRPPIVNGVKLSDRSCLRFWRDKTAEEVPK